jgi:hypothetical protein
MATIVPLRPEEAAQKDIKNLESLFNNLGPREAEAFTARALDELGRRVDQMRRAHRREDAAALVGLGRELARIATQVGLVGLARVARDAAGCAQTADPVTLSAVCARLDRMAAHTLASTRRARNIQN